VAAHIDRGGGHGAVRADAGTWEVAPEAYRLFAGAASMACAEVVAATIGARLLRVAGASHWPQREQAAVVNSALLALWESVPD
jgi:pimeloyl-ACP methyl ester carboxylesterase